jgi:hypothetical protein
MDVVNLLKEEIRMIELPKLEKAFEYENNPQPVSLDNKVKSTF